MKNTNIDKGDSESHQGNQCAVTTAIEQGVLLTLLDCGSTLEPFWVQKMMKSSSTFRSLTPLENRVNLVGSHYHLFHLLFDLYLARIDLL